MNDLAINLTFRRLEVERLENIWIFYMHSKIEKQCKLSKMRSDKLVCQFGANFRKFYNIIPKKTNQNSIHQTPELSYLISSCGGGALTCI